MMIQPGNKLPWKLQEEDEIKAIKLYSIKAEDGYVIENSLFKSKLPDREDAEYIVVAANKYPVLLDFLERLESTTKDKETADKIRELLIKEGLWK